MTFHTLPILEVPSWHLYEREIVRALYEIDLGPVGLFDFQFRVAICREAGALRMYAADAPRSTREPKNKKKNTTRWRIFSPVGTWGIDDMSWAKECVRTCFDTAYSIHFATIEITDKDELPRVRLAFYSFTNEATRVQRAEFLAMLSRKVVLESLG